MRFELPGADNPDYLNNSWIGVYQEIRMYSGNKYQIEIDIDRVVPDSIQYPTILNIYAYKPGSAKSPPVWLGSVDYKFNQSGLHIYSQKINPSETATYEIVVRVFGWGNEGKAFSVNVDNIKVLRIK